MSNVINFSELNAGDTFEDDEGNYYIKGSYSSVSDIVNSFNIMNNTFCKFGQYPVKKVNIEMLITK